jgi:hypothetical protein
VLTALEPRDDLTRIVPLARLAPSKCREWGSNPQAAFAAADFKLTAVAITERHPSYFSGNSWPPEAPATGNVTPVVRG